MPEPRPWTNSEDYFRCLNALRAKTDSVPEQHRAAFRREIDLAHRLYERAQHTFARIEEMVAGLSRVAKHT